MEPNCGDSLAFWGGLGFMLAGGFSLWWSTTALHRGGEILEQGAATVSLMSDRIAELEAALKETGATVPPPPPLPEWLKPNT